VHLVGFITNKLVTMHCRSHEGNIQGMLFSTTAKHWLGTNITRVIQKISSVWNYCRCSAAVTMVRMRAEFVDSVARHGRNLQTFEQCLCITLCVYNAQENRESRHM
jgi:hypothetical protein